MRIEVEAVQQVTDELVEACRRLLPQLSSSAAPLGAEDLARITDHQANTLFVARSQGVIGSHAGATWLLGRGGCRR